METALDRCIPDSAGPALRLAERRADEPRYALDTEFHGERSYWPRLALVQIAWPSGHRADRPVRRRPEAARRDPRRSGLMVAHAAEQDLAILERACGRVPTQLFDTQVAAGFIGLGAPSLASLVERLLGTRLTKGDRLTDWTRRPLTAEQRAVRGGRRRASPRVARRARAHGSSRCRPPCSGRPTSARNDGIACAARPEPDIAWWRIKGARQLRGRPRGVAQAVAAWRERTAESLDVPPRFVLSDLALTGIVSRPPRDARGAHRHPRHRRPPARRQATELLAAVRRARDSIRRRISRCPSPTTSTARSRPR